MKNNEKFDFIRDIYNSEKQEVPETLSKDNITDLLNDVQQGQKKTRIIPIRQITAVAAAFIVIICAVFVGNRLRSELPAVDSNNGTTENNINEALSTEESEAYEEIENYFLDRFSEYHKNKIYNYADDFVDDAIGFIYNSVSGNKATMDEADAETVPESAAPTMSATQSQTNSTSGPHGETNIQVENVNEADVIKNDGEYLYILSDSYKDNLYDGDVVYIVRGSDLEKVATITVERKDNTVFSGKEMYVEGNKLFIVAEKADVKVKEIEEEKTTYTGETTTPPSYAETVADKVTVDDTTAAPYDAADNEYVFSTYCLSVTPAYSTVILTYDISDITNPKLINEKTQSGEYESSRMINGVIYTVTTYGVNFDDKDKKTVKEECIPKINGKRIAADDIDTSENVKEKLRSYTVVSASDTSAEDLAGASYAYLGYCQDIYCTTDTLYFTYEDYSESDTNYTVINAVSLSKDDITFKNKGKVEGDFNNQFSMDEYNGYFRVATTSYNYSTFKNESNIYVLNSKLEVVGKLENMADNEEVKSVRFVGDTAYVVTFEQTDPLFIVDLSEPTEPKVTGYVKLPGYSTYLHPVGDRYLVGVGYGGTETSADMSTLKVTLFDVSNPEKPVVASSFEVCEAGTEITDYDNHKAFLYYAEENLIGIPVKKYDYTNGYREVYSYAMLEIKDGELQLKNGYVHQQQEGTRLGGLFRGTYIADTLYTISDRSVCAFELESGELIKMTVLR